MSHIAPLIMWLAVKRKLLRKLLTDLGPLILPHPSFSNLPLHFLPWLMPQGVGETQQSWAGSLCGKGVSTCVYGRDSKDGIPRNWGKDFQWAEAMRKADLEIPQIHPFVFFIAFEWSSRCFHFSQFFPYKAWHPLLLKKRLSLFTSTYQLMPVMSPRGIHKSFSLQPAAL